MLMQEEAKNMFGGFKNFRQFRNLAYGLTEKSDGPMELARVNLLQRNNRACFLNKFGIEQRQTVSAKLIHSNKIAVVKKEHAATTLQNCDGLITNTKNLALCVTVADCFPVYFFETVSQTIGLAHCGWRGVVAGLPVEMVKHFGKDPAKIFVGIGPGIQACHFKIQKDILRNFDNYPEAVIYSDQGIFVDLPKIITSQLKKQGVLPNNIENLNECTSCNTEKYFSFRRDKPEELQAMLAYIQVT